MNFGESIIHQNCPLVFFYIWATKTLYEKLEHSACERSRLQFSEKSDRDEIESKFTGLNFHAKK